MSNCVFEHEYLISPDRELMAQQLEAAAKALRAQGFTDIPLGGTVVAHVHLAPADMSDFPGVWIEAAQ